MKPSKGGLPGVQFRFWRFLALFLVSKHFRAWLDLTLQYAFSHSRTCRGGGHPAVALFDLTYGHHLHKPMVNKKPSPTSYRGTTPEDDSVRLKLKEAAEKVYGHKFSKFFFVGQFQDDKVRDGRYFFTGADTWETIYMVGHVLDNILFDGAQMKTKHYLMKLINDVWEAPQPGLHPERSHDTQANKSAA